MNNNPKTLNWDTVLVIVEKKLGLTVPDPIVIWLYIISTGVDETWTPKNVAVLRKMSFTVEFIEIISVATPVLSEPAWTMRFSNVMLCKTESNSSQNQVIIDLNYIQNVQNLLIKATITKKLVSYESYDVKFNIFNTDVQTHPEPSHKCPIHMQMYRCRALNDFRYSLYFEKTMSHP